MNFGGRLHNLEIQLLVFGFGRRNRHGRGLVLRREGSGDQTKLTVSFPGYGQKKLVEKYAGLEKG